MHDPGHSSEECKLLKVYSKIYAAQRPYKDNKGRYSGKTKPGEYVEFNSTAKEANIMEHGDPIPKKNKGKTSQKPQEWKRQDKTKRLWKTYGIEHLKIGEATHNSD